MTSRVHTDYISDVCDALEKCLLFTEGMQFSGFTEDEKTVFAVIRALEVVGEAVKQIPASLQEKYPVIPWREMAGMRDILIHHYFSVNPEVVWKTVTEDIPELLPVFQQILADQQQDNG